MSYIALIDVHAMYVAAEQVCNPSLRSKPCAVLSNGDSIVVAANKEAKALGLEKFKPAFQQQDLLGQSVHVFSSNYRLYANLSSRMYRCIQSTDLFSDLHAYSIDESFGQLSSAIDWSYDDLIDVSRQVRRAVWQEVRLPVGVGFGRTLTLAKVASSIGKTVEGYRGICALVPENEDDLLRLLPVKSVWGVGRATATLLARQGINTAYELKKFDPVKARGLSSINLERTIRELNGEQVFTMASFPDVESRKEVSSSITLTEPATTKLELHQAISARIAIAAEKLRKLGLVSRVLVIYASSKQYDKGGQVRQKTVEYHYPVDDTRTFIQSLSQCIDDLFVSGNAYRKIGCRLISLSDASHMQADLFAPKQDSKLMGVVDQLNTKYGDRVVSIGSVKVESRAGMVRSKLSPNYMSEWGEIPKVRC